MILWLAHCDMWPAQSSKFSITAHASSELSKCISWCVFQSASFLYIVVLCQSQLVELSRFQYYLDCDCTFDLFYSIEVYICKASLFLSQHTFRSSVYDLHSSIYHVMKSKTLSLLLLCSMLESHYIKCCKLLQWKWWICHIDQTCDIARWTHSYREWQIHKKKQENNNQINS